MVAYMLACPRRSDEGLGLALMDPCQQTSRWTALADAAWDEVLQLVHPNDVPNARLVCRAWYRDVSRCLHSLHLVEPSTPMLARLAAAFPRLTSLQATCCSPARSARSHGGARDGTCGGGKGSSNASGAMSTSTGRIVGRTAAAGASILAPSPKLLLSFPSLTRLSLHGYSAMGLAMVPAPEPAPKPQTLRPPVQRSSATGHAASFSSSSGSATDRTSHPGARSSSFHTFPTYSHTFAMPGGGVRAMHAPGPQVVGVKEQREEEENDEEEEEEQQSVMACPAQLLGSCCRTLAMLELRDCLVIGGLQAVQACRQLSSLRLLGCRFPTAGPAPLACLASLPHLRHLELRSTPHRRSPAIPLPLDAALHFPHFPALGMEGAVGDGGLEAAAEDDDDGAVWEPAAAAQWAAPLVPGLPMMLHEPSGALSLGGLSSLSSLRSLTLELGLAEVLQAMAQVAALKQLEALELYAIAESVHHTFELDAVLPGIVKSLPRLTMLMVAGHTAVHDRHLHLLSRLPALQSLSLSLSPTPATPEIWWGHPILHALDPAPAPAPATPPLFESGWAEEGVTGEALAALLLPAEVQQGSKQRRFRDLALGSVPLMPDAVAVVGRLQGLESLDVSGIRCIDDAFLFSLASLPHLQHLNLAGCTGISNIGLAHLAKCGSQLQYLDVSGCNPHVSDLGLVKLGALRHLQHLVASCLERVTDAGVLGLVQQPHPCKLRSVDLSLCPRITSQALHALAAHARELNSLRIDCCDSITVPGVLAVLSQCPCLSELSAQHCQAGVQQAAEALPYYSASAQRRKARQHCSTRKAWWMEPM